MYTPVPVVMAGDWIDEVFINTYWGDNMAAGVPDIFSAAGDLAIGSGNNAASALPVGSDGQVLTVDTAESLKLKYAAIPDQFVKFSSLSGSITGIATPNTGTYNLDTTNIPNPVPSTAKAILLAAQGLWADVSLNPNCIIESRTGGLPGVMLFGQVNGKTIANSGVLPLGTGGLFRVRIQVANMSQLTMYCSGYLI